MYLIKKWDTIRARFIPKKSEGKKEKPVTDTLGEIISISIASSQSASWKSDYKKSRRRPAAAACLTHDKSAAFWVKLQGKIFNCKKIIVGSTITKPRERTRRAAFLSSDSD